MRQTIAFFSSVHIVHAINWKRSCRLFLVFWYHYEVHSHCITIAVFDLILCSLLQWAIIFIHLRCVCGWQCLYDSNRNRISVILLRRNNHLTFYDLNLHLKWSLSLSPDSLMCRVTFALPQLYIACLTNFFIPVRCVLHCVEQVKFNCTSFEPFILKTLIGVSQQRASASVCVERASLFFPCEQKARK